MTEKDENGFNIEEELKKLPASPGVYIMHDRHDEIITWEGHKHEKPVRQYFQKAGTGRPRSKNGVPDRPVRVITDSELERPWSGSALIRSTVPGTIPC